MATNDNYIVIVDQYFYTVKSYFKVHSLNERKSEQDHIPHAPTLLENAVYNEWQFQALGTGNRTKKGI